MRVVVCGGAGFVGQQVVRDLIARGDKVTVIDNCSRGVKANIPEGVHFVHGDVRDMDLVPAFTGADWVFDFAARVYGVRNLYNQPGTLLADNVEMTIKILDAVAKAKVKRYLYVSSSCVYDFPGAVVPHREDDVGICDTSYGQGKQFGEALTQFYAEEYGLQTRIVRLFNVFGPKDSFQSPHVIPDFLRKAWRLSTFQATTFPIIGNGSQTRDFTWLADAAAGILAVADHGKSGQPYNIGTGREISVRALAGLCLAQFDLSGAEFVEEEAPARDIQRRSADIARIASDTGWAPQTSLEDGLRRVKDWIVTLLETGQLDD